MGDDPSAIREEIATTREEIGETIDQLAARSDVRGRARGWMRDRAERAASGDLPVRAIVGVVAFVVALVVLRRIVRR
jgi:hypothetical protein